MDINAYTVCDETGQTGPKKGAIATPDKGYTFYIQLKEPVLVDITPNQGETPEDVLSRIELKPGEKASYITNDDSTITYWRVECAEVGFVMPLGGPMEGFFRFPRVGEKVLAGRLGDTVWNPNTKGLEFPSGDYVLMGFMPTSEAPFYPEDAVKNMTLEEAQSALVAAQVALSALSGDALTAKQREIDALNDYINNYVYEPGQKNPGGMDDFLNDKGMALRYKRDDGNAGDWGFSEIGFYKKDAKWPKTEGGSDCPKQDTINIQSTGDIESRAENYHLLKANRFEILAGEDAKEISPKTRITNANSDEWKKDNAPLGDHVMDDPGVHKGDLHIRAGKNVVIKAEGEIRLQVGRTTLLINDSGFSVVSRKVNSNVPTNFDTSLALNPRTGISMFGQTVGIGAGHSFSISEGLGGVVSSTAGVLSLGGREVKAASANTVAQVSSLTTYGLDLVANASVAGTAIDYTGKTAQKAAFIIDKVEQIAKIALNCFFVCYDIYKTYQAAQDTYNAMKAGGENATGAGDQRPQQGGGQQALPPPVPNPPGQAQPAPNDQQILSDQNDTVSKVAGMIGLEPLECVSTCLAIILDLTSIAYTAVETHWSSHPDKFKNIKDLRNNLNVVSMAVDNGILEVFAIAMTAMASAPAPAVLRLRANGDAVIKAAADKSFYALEAKKGAGTTTLVSTAWMTGLKMSATIGAAIPPITAAITQIITGEKSVEDLKVEGL